MSDEIDVQANRVLGRYAMVWIWSVLFGSGTGSLYFSTSLARAGGWRGADLLIGGFVLLSGLLGLSCLVTLLRFLSMVLIPLLFQPSLPERSLQDVGARLLLRSYILLLGSMVFGLCGILTQFAFGALR